jgi:hypothetical protein
MTDIRINALPADTSPNAADVVPIDGSTTRKTTLTNLVNAGRPFASQAEAEAGTLATKGMSPLTTAQAIAAIGGTLFALIAWRVPAGGTTNQVLAKVSGTDNDVGWTNAGGDLRHDTTANLTAGFTSTTYDNGTKTTGTFTPDPANGGHQKAAFNGALTLAPPSTGTGDATTLTLTVTNGASAGAITTSGFTKVDGSFDTTDTNKFKCFMTIDSVASYLNIVAMQ